MIFSEYTQRVFTGLNAEEFREVAAMAYRYQTSANPLFNNYLNALRIAPEENFSFEKITFLPIEFFKTHEIKSGQFEEEITFTSSGTGKMSVSRHLVKDLRIYTESFLRGFNLRYGDPSAYTILGLLPSYLERQGSSLIYMVDELIKRSGDSNSGFFLREHDLLAERIRNNQITGKKTLLIGVTFALLDFASSHPAEMKNTIIMETGGMKGRGAEITRQELTQRLKDAFPGAEIHSEYGMTELLSQAYSVGNGIFVPPPWMKVVVRDTTDPLSWKATGSGALNIIDLANIHSCSFIATQDLGKVYDDGSFEVSGRFDHADARGCNLLVV